MPVRSGPEGYGGVAKALHWLTVAALVAQFTVGYVMDVDDSGHGRGRGRGRGGESGRGRRPGRRGRLSCWTTPARCSPRTCSWAR